MKVVLIIISSLFLQACVSFGAIVNNANDRTCKNDLMRATHSILIEEGESDEVASTVALFLSNEIARIRYKRQFLTVNVDQTNQRFTFSTENYTDGCKLVYIGYSNGSINYTNTINYINKKPIYSCYCVEPK